MCVCVVHWFPVTSFWVESLTNKSERPFKLPSKGVFWWHAKEVKETHVTHVLLLSQPVPVKCVALRIQRNTTGKTWWSAAFGWSRWVWELRLLSCFLCFIYIIVMIVLMIVRGQLFPNVFFYRSTWCFFVVVVADVVVHRREFHVNMKYDVVALLWVEDVWFSICSKAFLCMVLLVVTVWQPRTSIQCTYRCFLFWNCLPVSSEDPSAWVFDMFLLFFMVWAS